MQYRVIYLSVGERETLRLDAPNAATAVTMAERVANEAHNAFELLSVTPEATAPAAPNRSRRSSGRAA